MRRFLPAMLAFILLLPLEAAAQRRKDAVFMKEIAQLRHRLDSLQQLTDSLRSDAAVPAADTNARKIVPPALKPEYTPELTDSLIALWYRSSAAGDYAALPEIPDTVRLASQVSDSVMVERLRSLNPAFSLPFNGIVRNYMTAYSEKRGENMQNAMGLSNWYFPIFEETFRRYGLPLELKYLAVVESMLKPTATSRAGAKGLWQFMYRTAKAYGLRIDSFVDERMDVEKSTDAAARYLKALHDMLGDWPLAISAYNCGAGNVNKAIRRAGGRRDFWSVYPYLPRETRGYMPAFVGVMYAFAYSRDYGLEASQVGVPGQVDTFELHRNVHFGQISEVVGVPIEDLRYLNPKYYNDIVPADTGTLTIKLPYEWSSAFLDAVPDSIYTHNASLYLSEKVLTDIAEGKRSNASGSTGTSRACHTVRSGDTLSHIARRYGVSVRQLMDWNKLRSDRLSIGQKIYIY